MSGHAGGVAPPADRPIELGRDPELVTPRMVARQAALRPDAPFIESVEGDSATYGEVHVQALRYAAALRDRLGVRAREPVAVMLSPSLAAHRAWLGCGWLGCWEVPVNTMYRGRMLCHVLADCGARVAIVGRRFLDQLPVDRGALPDLEVIVVPDDLETPRTAWRTLNLPELLDGVEPALDLAPPAPGDVAAILYTSGTTGASKGVLVPWAELSSGIGMFPREWMGEEPAHYAPLPVYHLGGKLPLTLMAHVGGRVVLRETFSTSAFWDDVVRFGATTTFMTPTIAHFIHRRPPQACDAEVTLRATNMGPAIPEVDDFQQRFDCRVVGLYGMTEVGWPLFLHGVDGTTWRSCGRPRAGYQLRIVDEQGRDLPDGTAGELLVRADDPVVMNAGYFNRPEDTANAWRDGWFHTGDAFVRDGAGLYYFVDRVKDSIRRRGENISSAEVELEVEAHPAVAESAAVAVPSEVGEDDVKVVVVTLPGTSLEPADLITFLIPRMPRFMVPRYVEIVAELPKTATGKVRKVELREAGVTAGTWDRERAGIEVPR